MLLCTEVSGRINTWGTDDSGCLCRTTGGLVNFEFFISYSLVLVEFFMINVVFKK